MAKWISRSVEDTAKFARDLAKVAKPGDVIYLEGNLGAGKTVFAKYFCAELGYEGFVHSPTYALVHSYENRPPIFHLDLYRLEEQGGFEELGLDYYDLPSGITLIEWPSNELKGLLPPNYLIEIETIGEEERLITLLKSSLSL